MELPLFQGPPSRQSSGHDVVMALRASKMEDTSYFAQLAC